MSESPALPPPPAPPARRRFDPAVLPILAGGVVLLFAIGWLWRTPRPEPMAQPDLAAPIAALEARIAAQEQALAGRLTAQDRVLEALPRRLAVLEGRPVGSDPGPLAAELARLADRLGTAEMTADRRITALEGRPPFDPAPLAARLDRMGERQTQMETRDAEQERRAEATGRAMEGRIIAAETQAATRAATMETALAGRIGGVETSTAQRLTAVEAAATQRLAALEQTLAARLAALEAREQRLAAAEARLARLVAAKALEAALAAGQPLGPSLAGLGGTPPAALARFAAAPPPTEPGLRLSFEEAARAARAAVDPGSGQGVVDAAAARLAGLVTVRRGETVVWGDAAAGEIERARLALAAGDVTLALERVDRLPAPAKAAMESWVSQARALLAARAAVAALPAS